MKLCMRVLICNSKGSGLLGGLTVWCGTLRWFEHMIKMDDDDCNENVRAVSREGV